MKETGIRLSFFFFIGILIAAVFFGCGSRPDVPGGGGIDERWVEDAVFRECTYIKNCSWTEYARNYPGNISGGEAYGCLNVVRIHEKGPDYVHPGEAGIAAIGFMRGVIELSKRNRDIGEFDRVLHKFFTEWSCVNAKGGAQNFRPDDPDEGAWAAKVYYSRWGDFQGISEWNTLPTAQMIIAMWKYHEYLSGLGESVRDAAWLDLARPSVQRAADFLCRMADPVHGLVRSNSRAPDMWIGNASFAAAALQCAARWAGLRGEERYGECASRIVEGIREMRDRDRWALYYKVRRAETGLPDYDNCIDQLCFVPFEADILDPSDRFAGEISDWWTDPGRGADFSMTCRTGDPLDWRYWGTHWKHYFAANEENERLYPGPGFQLAKVEWKHGNATGGPRYTERAARRFRFGYDKKYSNLWFGSDGRNEAGVGNGIVDWRNENDYEKTAGSWERYIDTSSYFIQVIVMLWYGIDTRYVPDR
ncbi:MAG: hypothetical protein JW881_04655 [Spirochaetales bacterium]|nr:hypothetical protein [Spirochaetales bacterium]